MIPITTNLQNKKSLCSYLRKDFLPGILITIIFAGPAFAVTSAQVHALLLKNAKTALTKRVVSFSALFLNTPYQFEPLGEGSTGEFNQGPLYRFDRFDCETYVDTVLSLAFAHDWKSFQQNMLAMRYQDSTPDFFKRNHFPEIDWLPNNTQKAFIKNITSSLAPASQLVTATVIINRQRWYQLLPASRINLPDASTDDVMQKLLLLLHQYARNTKNVQVTLSYIPFAVLPQTIAEIPSAAVIFIVKPSSAEQEQAIGTALLISHMGFAVRKHGTVYLRAASSWKGKVIDLPLLPYVKYQKGVKGIIVLMPDEQRQQPKPA